MKKIARSAGYLAKPRIKFDKYEDGFAYFEVPERVRVNMETSEIERQTLPSKVCPDPRWVSLPMISNIAKNKGSANGNLWKSNPRFTIHNTSWSAARLLLTAKLGRDLSSEECPKAIDGNNWNLKLDNFDVTDARELHKTKDPELRKLLDTMFKPGQRNYKNKKYQHLMNTYRGPDGETHITRSRKRKSEE